MAYTISIQVEELGEDGDAVPVETARLDQTCETKEETQSLVRQIEDCLNTSRVFRVQGEYAGIYLIDEEGFVIFGRGKTRSYL